MGLRKKKKENENIRYWGDDERFISMKKAMQDAGVDGDHFNDAILFLWSKVRDLEKKK